MEEIITHWLGSVGHTCRVSGFVASRGEESFFIRGLVKLCGWICTPNEHSSFSEVSAQLLSSWSMIGVTIAGLVGRLSSDTCSWHKVKANYLKILLVFEVFLKMKYSLMLAKYSPQQLKASFVLFFISSNGLYMWKDWAWSCQKPSLNPVMWIWKNMHHGCHKQRNNFERGKKNRCLGHRGVLNRENDPIILFVVCNCNVILFYFPWRQTQKQLINHMFTCLLSVL